MGITWRRSLRINECSAKQDMNERWSGSLIFQVPVASLICFGIRRGIEEIDTPRWREPFIPVGFASEHEKTYKFSKLMAKGSKATFTETD